MQEIIKLSWNYALIGFMTSFIFICLWVLVTVLIATISSYEEEKRNNNE